MFNYSFTENYRTPLEVTKRIFLFHFYKILVKILDHVPTIYHFFEVSRLGFDVSSNESST